MSTISCLGGTAEEGVGREGRAVDSCVLSCVCLALARSTCSPELFLLGCAHVGLGARSCSRAFESELHSLCICGGLSLGMVGWWPVLFARGFTDSCNPLAGLNRMPLFCRRGFWGIAGRWPNVLEALVDGLVTG